MKPFGYLWKIFRHVSSIVGMVVIFGIFGASIYTFGFLHSLPDINRMSFHDLKKKAEKRLETELKSEPYPWVPIESISKNAITAILVSEDATFYEHDGIDYGAIVDSALENVKRKKYAFGASTISQQVVKNLFLTKEKTLNRKIKEYFITRDLESVFSKSKILEIYLNMAEFGPGIYGIGAASQRYFTKTPSDLTAFEGVYLSLFLPSPKRTYVTLFEKKTVSPGNKKKMKRILSDLLRANQISDEEFRLAMSEEWLMKAADATVPEDEVHEEVE